jgi:integrase
VHNNRANHRQEEGKMTTTKRPTWERTGVPSIYKQQGRSPRDPRYRVAWRDAAGRPQTTTFGSWDTAQSFKAEHRVSRNNGQRQDAVLGRTTFAEFWPHYMRVAGPAASGSKAQYERLGRIHILPVFGEMQMAHIRARHISAFQAKLREAGRATTTNHAMRVLNRALRIAVREEYIPRHPGLGIEVDRPGKRADVRFMTWTEVVEISNAVPARYRALVLFLGETGLRIGEAVALRVRDINLDERTVRVERAVKEVDGKLLTERPKTERSIRTVHFSNGLKRVLAEHLMAFVPDRANPDAPVFTRRRKGDLRATSFRKNVFQPAARKLGILDKAGQPPHTHDLRHTAAALLIRAGRPEREVAEKLGDSVAIIHSTYGHLYADSHREGADALDALLYGG